MTKALKLDQSLVINGEFDTEHEHSVLLYVVRSVFILSVKPEFIFNYGGFSILDDKQHK